VNLNETTNVDQKNIKELENVIQIIYKIFLSIIIIFKFYLKFHF